MDGPTRRRPEGEGQIENSYGGRQEEETWGKRAMWCDYYGPLDGETAGVCLMDFPTNPRYPTHWHVRAYGLMTANPFGLHDYYNDSDTHRGDWTIPAYESRNFLYRVLLHRLRRAGQVRERYHDRQHPLRGAGLHPRAGAGRATEGATECDRGRSQAGRGGPAMSAGRSYEGAGQRAAGRRAGRGGESGGHRVRRRPGHGAPPLRSIREARGAELIAVCDIDAGRREKAAQEFGCKAYASVDVAGRQVQVVNVAVPTGLHARWGSRWPVRAPRHLREAPGCQSGAGRRLDRACATTGSSWPPSSSAPAASLPAGQGDDRQRAPGALHYADIHLYWYRADSYCRRQPPAWRSTFALDGGGACMNQGIHSIDLISWLAGGVRTVYARTGLHPPDRGGGRGHRPGHLPQRALGNITCTTSAYPGLTNDLHILGSKGSIVISDDRVVTWRIKREDGDEGAEKAEEEELRGPLRGLLRQRGGRPPGRRLRRPYGARGGHGAGHPGGARAGDRRHGRPPRGGDLRRHPAVRRHRQNHPVRRPLLIVRRA